MVPLKAKDLWFTALWEDFFKFHKLPEFQKPFSILEWQDYFYQLGKRYTLENLHGVDWIESRTFEVFSNIKQIRFLESIVEGFDIVNKQLGLNFQLRNLEAPNLA